MTLPTSSDITPHVLPDWLSYRAVTTPERLALIAGEERSTFAQLDTWVTLTARRLAALGINSDSRVATLLPNSARVVEIVHALRRLGAVLVPLNTRLTAAELAWQIGDVGARLLVVDDRTASLANEIRAELPDLTVVTVGVLPGNTTRLAEISPAEPVPGGPREWIDLDAVMAIIYTSGTTGRPKGAMLSYGNFWWSALGSALNLGSHADDRWLACMPLFHVGGLSILTRSAIYGITAIVHESFDPAAVNQAIDEERVTIVSVVSTMLRRMLAERGERPYPPWLRCVLLGGGPAPRPLLESCAARDIPVVQTYGLSETCSQVATLAPEDALPKLGSAGKPLYPNEIRIDVDGRAATSDEPGEILVRGPIVTAGYINRPEETARALAGGWLHTGDIGRLDADGYLYILDRRSDLIVSGGENVYPAEVEAALLAHPAVEEAGVIGLPHPDWGQTVVAVVRLTEGATVSEDELRAFCRERLAGYKVPSQVRFTMEALPRNAGGKLLRRVLRDA